MAEYDNTNRGALFRNAKKESESHADYTGSINVGGTDYWLNAWLKETQEGTKYFSLSVKPKQAKAVTKSSKTPKDMDSDIPF